MGEGYQALLLIKRDQLLVRLSDSPGRSGKEKRGGVSCLEANLHESQGKIAVDACLQFHLDLQVELQPQFHTLLIQH